MGVCAEGESTRLLLSKVHAALVSEDPFPELALKDQIRVHERITSTIISLKLRSMNMVPYCCAINPRCTNTFAARW